MEYRGQKVKIELSYAILEDNVGWIDEAYDVQGANRTCAKYKEKGKSVTYMASARLMYIDDMSWDCPFCAKTKAEAVRLLKKEYGLK